MTEQRTNHARQKEIYRESATLIIGLTLALSAFSLNDAEINEIDDVWRAVSYFTASFVFTVTIWSSIVWLFEWYPPDDHIFYATIVVVLFLTTVAPFFLNLLLDPKADVRRLGDFLFPLDLTAVQAMLAALRVRLVRRHRALVSDDVARNSLLLSYANVAVCTILLASILIPLTDQTTRFSGLLWSIALIARLSVAPLIRRMQDRRQHVPLAPEADG